MNQFEAGFASAATSKRLRLLHAWAALVTCALTWTQPVVGEAQPLPHDLPKSSTNASERHLTILRGNAEVIRYGSEPGTVIVGDEAVAGATIATSDVLVLTGIGSGETNVIVLDESGGKIDHIALKVREKGSPVIVRRGQITEALLCNPVCVSTGEPKADSAPTGGSPPESASAIVSEAGNYILHDSEM